MTGAVQNHGDSERLRHEGYAAGFAKAIKEVLWLLRYVDWQEETAADAVEAKFGDHPHVKGQS